MRIQSMTATFGKLEGQTLTLQPGLNLISAPNEWGKSTWCAFLMAMLYGVDTRARSTQSGLADKEHYAPWSGSPMSGKMEIEWNGRKITIERSTKGRIPLGEFRAYETASGLDVPELTAANCGQVLLGAERGVFRRAGFIRLADLPVTEDEDLRRRLNALVTTGEESNDGALLQKGLRELQSRLRRKPNGQIPLLTEQQRQLQDALDSLSDWQRQQREVAAQLADNEREQRELQNHQAALDYERAQQDQWRVNAAELVWQRAEQERQDAEAMCRSLPTAQEAEKALHGIDALRKELLAFQQEQQAQALPPTPPDGGSFAGMEPEDIRQKVAEDAAAFRNRRGPVLWGCLTLLAAVTCGALLFAKLWAGGAVTGGLAAVFAVLFAFSGWQCRKQRFRLAHHYGSPRPEAWRQNAEAYCAALLDYRQQEKAYRNTVRLLTDRRQEMKQKIVALCGEQGLESCCAQWEAVLAHWKELDAARAGADRAAQQYESLKAMARPLPPAPETDIRQETEAETAARLDELQQQERKLRQSAGKLQGMMENLGTPEAIERQLLQAENRLEELNRYAAALELAQQTLQKATEELQRRFAPRISQLGRQYLSRLTLGKYDRLSLDASLTLRSGSREEITLRQPMWRSEGTADQLYLALRLAVAQTLTPKAPVILDDALVRFDDARLGAALGLLQELAADRQILLFTCQNREKQLLQSN